MIWAFNNAANIENVSVYKVGLKWGLFPRMLLAKWNSDIGNASV